jgi:hypothetical protein
MAARQHFVLVNDAVRRNAAAAVMAAPEGYRVTISQPSRSADQNAYMWALLTDIANAKPEGRQWDVETWKAAFMHFLGHQVRFAEGLEGSGPFPVGFRSSRLTVGQMRDLIDCILAYGTQRGVEWTETRRGGWNVSNAT